MYRDVLNFWFEQTEPKKWWIRDAGFDEEIHRRFGALAKRAAAGELYQWRQDPEGRLAELLVLDQFSRHLYRDTPRAFAQDATALVLAQEAVAAGVPEQLEPVQRHFLYMPFMHSESRDIHIWAERLFKELGLADAYDFELKHKAIIDRFGRYPHRNATLGRTSTPEELEFLKQPGSSF